EEDRWGDGRAPLITSSSPIFRRASRTSGERVRIELAPMRTNTDEMGPRESEFRFRGFRIAVIDGPNKGLEAQSEGSELSIGTAPANQLVLSDPAVSRHHCTILVTPGAVLLQDLESTNGTVLAGQRIVLAHLTKRVQIEIGNTTLRFDPLEREIGEPLSED